MFILGTSQQIKVTQALGDVQVGTLERRLDHMQESYYQSGAIAASFESLNAFFNHLQTHWNLPQRDGDSSRRGTGSGFNTFKSYEEAMHAYLKEPHTIRVFETREENIKVPDSIGNEAFFDVTGDYIDIGRFLEGDPEHFGNMYMGNPNNIFATILLNLSATCWFDESAVRRRGERVVRLVDWLESQRIRCNIMAFMSNQCAHIELQVKTYTDPLDLDSLAIVTHTDFFRRCVFRLMEYSATWNSMYGTATMYSAGRMKMPQLKHDDGILVFSENHPELDKIDKNFDKAERDITSMLDAGERTISLAL